MRAVVIRDFRDEEEVFLLEGKKAHHLINVTRIKPLEELLVLDGCGGKFHCEVVQVKKKNLSLKVLKKEVVSECSRLNLVVSFGQTKKESFELSIKQLIELGIREINILSTKYSQRYDIKDDRLQSIIESAMEQSNEAYFPILKYQNFDDFLETAENIIYFSSIGTNKGQLSLEKNKKYNLVFGPEGGLSTEEEKSIINKESYIVHLPTNIMRTSTAVNFCSGYIMALMQQ